MSRTTSQQLISKYNITDVEKIDGIRLWICFETFLFETKKNSSRSNIYRFNDILNNQLFLILKKPGLNKEDMWL